MTHLVPVPTVCLVCCPDPRGAVGEAPICSYGSLIQPKIDLVYQCGEMEPFDIACWNIPNYIYHFSVN